MVVDEEVHQPSEEMSSPVSRTELDTHANMPVVGKHALILSKTGQKAEVNAYTPDYDPLHIPIVDAAIRYDCRFTGQSCLLVIRNALYVPSMNNNLLPPFALREAGILVEDVPKIHVNDPGVENHSIFFKETGLRIPLFLWGVFSYFPSSKPTTEFANTCDDVYLLTPTNFDPHCDTYAYNEAGMLDWEGKMIDKDHRDQVIFSQDLPDDLTLSSSLALPPEENQMIDQNFDASSDVKHDCNDMTACACDTCSAVESDPLRLHERLSARATLGRYHMSIGSTNATPSTFLVDAPDVSDSDSDATPPPLPEDNEMFKDVWDHHQNGTINLDEIMSIGAAHGLRSRGLDASHLSKVWRIDYESAKRTIDITTQHSQRTDNPVLTRNFSTNDRMLRYRRIHEYFFMDTFFATSKSGKSSRGNTCCQLFVTDKGFVYVVPMKRRQDVLNAVKQFTKEIGAPDVIIADGAKEQHKSELRKFLGEIGTTLRVLEESTPWANRAELYIGLIKEAVRKDMRHSNCPLAFWDYCVERRARINNLVAKDLFKLQGSNAHTAVTGEQGDISNLAQYDWYEWCYYRDNTQAFPLNREVLGRTLGPARGQGNEMCQWILKANGNIIPRRSHRPLTVAETHSDVEQKKRDLFDRLIEERWGTSINPSNQPNDTSDCLEEYTDDVEPARILPDIEDAVDNQGHLLNQQPLYDQILNAEVLLQLDDEQTVGKVVRRALGADGKTTGTYDPNPFLNTMMYEIEFPDGQVKEYGANIIAENMLAQADADGFTSPLLKSIIDYRKDESVAVPKSEKHVTTRRGGKRLRKTTKGFDLLIQWADQSESWVPLKDLKESHPIETAEFARSRGIDDEAAFAWWVPYTIRKRDVILSKVKARIRKTTHKYGIELPTSVQHAKEIDTRNRNTFWMDALDNEMRNVGIAFELLAEGQRAPPGWSHVTGHLVWDVKMDFTRKARWVLDGHKTPSATISTYAGVVSRESVRIAFTYAALNGLDVCAADIRNAYLQAPSSRKDYVICGPEFGLENVGRVALVHRALYGDKTAG